MEIEQDNGQKKGKTSKKSRKSKEEVSETETEASETEYDTTDVKGTVSGSSSGEESEAEVMVQKKKAASLKRKRSHLPTKLTQLVGVAVSDKTDERPETDDEANRMKADRKKKSHPTKRQKKSDEKEQPLAAEGEKTFNNDEGNEVKKIVPTKKSPILFDSGRVDFNLDTENPNNIIQKTVQISTGLKMTCKMLAGATMSSGKVSYPDWAALIFQKKIKDEKCFEFNLPLKDAPKIVEGLKFLISENKKFFNSV